MECFSSGLWEPLKAPSLWQAYSVSHRDIVVSVINRVLVFVELKCLPRDFSAVNCISLTITCAACYLHGVDNWKSSPIMLEAEPSRCAAIFTYSCLFLRYLSWSCVTKG